MLRYDDNNFLESVPATAQPCNRLQKHSNKQHDLTASSHELGHFAHNSRPNQEDLKPTVLLIKYTDDPGRGSKSYGEIRTWCTGRDFGVA
jgi:hypothetical protein